MRISQINLFPIKSCQGTSVQRASVTPLGLERDRLMVITDRKGQFISQRSHPKMALIKVSRCKDGWQLSSKNVEPINITADDWQPQPSPIKVWDDGCFGFAANAPVNQWLSDFLQQQVVLYAYDKSRPRPVDRHYADGHHVSYADGFPILLTNTASLNDLNSRLDKPVVMDVFRPNLVLDSEQPFIEDRLKSIRIGEVVLKLVKPCSRCVLTTVDPDTGRRRDDGEPLKTLASYRRQPGGVMFGMNAVVEREGVIAVGDVVEVLS